MTHSRRCLVYGYEGWKPTSYDTAKEALTAPRYNRFILTKPLVFEVVEQDATPVSANMGEFGKD